MWRGRGRKVRGRAAIGVEKERRDAFGGERVRGREIRGVWEDCERVEEETRRGEGARRGGDRQGEVDGDDHRRAIGDAGGGEGRFEGDGGVGRGGEGGEKDG